jgi:hypothetical protein
MNIDLYNRIDISNAGTECRNAILKSVFENLENLPALIEFGVNINYKNHFKAVWIIEMIAETKTALLIPHIDILCHSLSKFKNHSAIRGMSRTVLFISTSSAITLTGNQEEKIIETCLDWLIGNARIAPKVYAMNTLYEFGKKYDWINDDLKNILKKDYSNQSAGYRTSAKEILKKIK